MSQPAFTPSAEQAALLAQRPFELPLLGGDPFCQACTPVEVNEPGQVVTWPCPPLRAAGIGYAEGEAIIDREAAAEWDGE
ncbi:hypothetical protein [uncultured Thermomonospora sp.]|uniref:hypothetical protein n=1 Tax=uncultured Thermomonospora sp. TaxID=671175 RepID=UPI00259BA0AB|nr:hypothetical protein [uncultured Thermomonospora sp.]